MQSLFVFLIPKQELKAISWLSAEHFIKIFHSHKAPLFNVVTEISVSISHNLPRAFHLPFSYSNIDCKENGRTTSRLGKSGKRELLFHHPSL